MTKLPTHHQLWSRASNSTRASILVRSRSAAARTHTQDSHNLRHARGFRTDGAGSVGRDRGSRRGSIEEEATSTATSTTTLAIRQGGEAANRVEPEGTITQLYLPTTSAATSSSTTSTTAASASASGSYHSSSDAIPVVYGPLTAEDTLLASGARANAFAQASVDSNPSATSHYVPRTMPASLAMTSRSQPPRQLRTLWSPSTSTSGSASSSNGPASTSHMLMAPNNGWTPATATAPFSTIASLRAAASLLNSPYWPGPGVGTSHGSSAHGSTGTVTELDSDGVELDDQARASTSATTLSGSTGAPTAMSLVQSNALMAPPFRWEEILKAGISWTQSGTRDDEEVKATSSTAVDADVLASLAASIDTLLHLSTLAPASQYQREEKLSATGSSERYFTPNSAATEDWGQGPSSRSRADGSSSGSSSGWQSARPPSPSYQASSGRNSPSFAPPPATSSVANNVTSSNQISSTTAPPGQASLTPISTSPPIIASTSHPLLSVDPFSGVEARRSLTYSHHSPDTPSALPVFEFHHGAYGIPKRHPLAAAPSPRGGRCASGSSSGGSSSAPLKGTRSMLAAAADFLAGPQTPPPPPPKAQAPAARSPKPWKKLDPSTMRSVQVGEDSYFLRPDSIGIADGVGGWATRPGANPAMFSRLLMHFCSVELSRFDWAVDDSSGQDGGDRKRRRKNDSATSSGGQALYDEGEPRGVALERHEHLDPVEVMHRAWERCVRVARREGILGSTTALLALLRKDELRIANLGDCVLLIVRKGELLFRSQEQQHSFNFPVQLGMMVRRGTRDVEDLVEGLSKAGGKDTSKVGWTTASPSSSRDPEGQDEDYNSPEAEALVQEYTRRLDIISQRAAGLSQQAETEAKAKEREGLKRRALFEGKSEEEFEAEMKAGEEYDFDVNTGSSKSGPNDHQQKEEDEEEEEDEDRSTVYVGFDDAHPWDEPRRDCGRWTIKVQKGDIIIVASDGLVDNLFDDDIIEEVQRFAPPPPSPHHMDGQGDEYDDHHYHHHHGRYDEYEDGHSRSDYSRTDSGISLADSENVPPSSSTPYPPRDFSPQLLSEALASRAKAISQDSKAIVSPFQQRATEEGLHYVGGKHDDISVLVAVVGEAGGGGGGEGGAGGGGDNGEGVEGGGGGGGLELRAR